jgi:hypothetical protein
MMHSPITVADKASAVPCCRTSTPLKMASTMAFQPIVDITTDLVLPMRPWYVARRDNRPAKSCSASIPI